LEAEEKIKAIRKDNDLYLLYKIVRDWKIAQSLYNIVLEKYKPKWGSFDWELRKSEVKQKQSRG
jgi:hypothetical protein